MNDDNKDDKKPDNRSGFDRRRIDDYLGKKVRLSPPRSLTLQDLHLIRTALQTGENTAQAIALLDVAIALAS